MVHVLIQTVGTSTTQFNNQLIWTSN